jgi:hypothetical protein
MKLDLSLLEHRLVNIGDTTLTNIQDTSCKIFILLASPLAQSMALLSPTLNHPGESRQSG